MDRSNLTVLTGTLVTQMLFDAGRPTGVKVIRDDNVKHFQAGSEVTICGIDLDIHYPTEIRPDTVLYECLQKPIGLRFGL
jgi:hypothetical protein